MKLLKISVLGLLIFSGASVHGNVESERSVIDFSELDQPAGRRIGKKPANVTVSRLEQWVTKLKSARVTADTLLEEKEFTEPLKHFIISAIARLGLDIAKGAARGELEAGRIDVQILLRFLFKSILQGGCVGACLGAAGSWGPLPQVSTASLVEYDIFAQLLLEIFNGLGEDLIRAGSVDEHLCSYVMMVLLPIATAGFQCLLIRAGRHDRLSEKTLVEAALRGLRVHENTCAGK